MRGSWYKSNTFKDKKGLYICSFSFTDMQSLFFKNTYCDPSVVPCAACCACCAA